MTLAVIQGKRNISCDKSLCVVKQAMARQTHSTDTGWAWMILLASCMVLFMWDGLRKGLSVLLPTLKEQFETHTWMIGLMIALSQAVRDFTGIAMALVTVPCYSLLGQYFDRHYLLACSLFQGCGSLGMMIFAPLTQLLLDTYGWRNTLLLLGAMYFHVFVGGALLRKPNIEPDTDEQTYIALKTRDVDDNAVADREYDDSALRGNKLGTVDKKKNTNVLELFGLNLFSNLSFVAVCLMSGCMTSTFVGWIVYFIPHCLVKGMSPYEASFLSTLAGFAYLVGNFIFIPFVSKNIVSVRGAIYIASTVAVIALIVDKFCSTFVTLSISSMCFTCGIGVMYPLLDVCLKSVVELESLSKAFGWRTAMTGTFKILSGFIVGWIYDQTGTYDVGFYYLGAMQAVDWPQSRFGSISG
ncbi:monocarboxylate transporter 12-like isoform X2 [Amphiura filiformis]|uniref:monocarboxylate transporter 12-like isoform X2 n=1 Tax=Amphiura filiformis TaxID=82378 RepID=UPI003B2166BE